jgi:hypothetical protein
MVLPICFRCGQRDLSLPSVLISFSDKRTVAVATSQKQRIGSSLTPRRVRNGRHSLSLCLSGALDPDGHHHFKISSRQCRHNLPRGGVSPPSPSRLSSLTRILAGIHTDRPTHFAINRHSPCARLPFPNQSTTPRPFSPRDDQLRRFSGPATTVSTPGHLGGSTSRCVASRHLQVGGEVMCGAGNEGHEI